MVFRLKIGLFSAYLYVVVVVVAIVVVVAVFVIDGRAYFNSLNVGTNVPALSGFVPPLKCVPPPILCGGLSLNLYEDRFFNIFLLMITDQIFSFRFCTDRRSR